MRRFAAAVVSLFVVAVGSVPASADEQPTPVPLTTATESAGPEIGPGTPTTGRPAGGPATFNGTVAEVEPTLGIAVDDPRFATELWLDAFVDSDETSAVYAYLTVDGAATPAAPLLSVDDGAFVPMSPYDTLANGDGTTTYTYVTDLGLLPGTHWFVATWAGDAANLPAETDGVFDLGGPTLAAPTLKLDAQTWDSANGSLWFSVTAPQLPGGDCPTMSMWYALEGTDWLPADLLGETPLAAACTWLIEVTRPTESAVFVVDAWSDGWITSSSAELLLLLPAPRQMVLSPPLTGVGTGDVAFVTPEGTLLIVRNKSGAVVDAVELGSGWSDLAIYGPGDWNGDGRNDLMARNTAGQLWVYPGKNAASFGAAVQVGRGWTGYEVIPAGDMNGDRIADLLAIDSAGVLWLYPGAGGGSFRARIQVGRGWSAVDLFAAGDQNRDGKADILGLDAAGKLYFYAGKGNGSFARPVQVGRGWGGYMFASGGDLNGDKIGDLVGRDAEGNGWLYPGRAGGGFGNRTLLWSGF